MNLFNKDFDKAFAKISSSRKAKTLERLALFAQDEMHPLLHNHALHGVYEGYRSINITGDIRAIYKRIDGGFYFVDIGSHSELYE